MDDYITEVDKHKYKLNNHGVEMTGTFQRKSNGKNSFIPEGGGEPIFVAERNSAHAMNNDKVRIAFYAKRRGREAEGEVIEILERANDTFVGTLEVAKSYAFLVTENRTLANDIFIPKEKLKGGKTGDKAIVKVVEWPDKAKNPHRPGNRHPGARRRQYHRDARHPGGIRPALCLPRCRESCRQDTRRNLRRGNSPT